MPIVKIPVVQKFGIISVKYHHALQQSLLKKSEIHSENRKSNRPLEITEEFIEQFNSAEDLEEKKHLLDIAKKILHRCKRRSGFNSKGSGSHVDVNLAWTELILLAQCKGRIQEGYDVMLISMDHAHFNQDHIILLFFVAESVLYRICCDSAQRPYLCSSEVKISKLGLLTFLRLYVFHLLGQIKPYDDEKERLSTYLQALQSCESTYEPYPNVLSSIHIMLKVGTIICLTEIPMETHLTFQELLDSEPSLGDQGVTLINPFIMCCLKILLQVQTNSFHHQGAFDHLSQPTTGINQENWLDSVIGLFILGEAAKLDIFCLRALIKLGHSLISRLQNISVQDSKSNLILSTSWQWDIISTYIMILSDICLHGTTSEIQKHAFIGFPDELAVHTYMEDSSLYGLLFFKHSASEDDCNIDWIIHYGAVYNLIKVCHELQWNENRIGMRNAIWKALDNCRRKEKDHRIHEAVQLAEAEINGPVNPFIRTSTKTSSSPVSIAFSQYVGFRIASALSHHFLPPIVPYIALPRKYVHSQQQIKLPEQNKHKAEKKALRLSLREQYFVAEPDAAKPNFIIRTNEDLQKVIEEQWVKEMKIRKEEDEKLLLKTKEEKEKREDEHFRETMKKREQKLKKYTKPYELSLTNKDQH
ncbi:hypothetical protein GDO86_002199 [Hymenochirus boettgeri]|uniref:Transmembrane protein 232 n=1 Tax=Hymenochirus boettgeri TaxID=247094 RepID=A0A8T2KHI7_9PIPI|nr:hypothetical protein GDO86_002199 [Hymenochirus boettgeri]